MPLPVSAPFHTSLMQPAAEKLSEMILATTFSSPQIPVVHNVNAGFESNPEAIKQLMIQQIYQPVQWVNCVHSLSAKGVQQAVECGPGKVLVGMLKRIDRSIASNTTDSISAITSAIESVAVK